MIEAYRERKWRQAQLKTGLTRLRNSKLSAGNPNPNPNPDPNLNPNPTPTPNPNPNPNPNPRLELVGGDGA